MLPNKNKQNAIPLVLPIEEISLWPELSSPAHFRIQVSESSPLSVTDERTDKRTDERRKSLCLIWDFKFIYLFI